LKHEERSIPLGPKTFDLLLYLAQHPHQVVTKEELLAGVWPNSFVEESNLSQHVFLLRKALGTSGQGEQVVVTIPGKGYQFAASVEQAPRPGVNQGPGEPVLDSVQSVTRLVVEEGTGDATPEVLDLAAPPKRRRWLLWVAPGAAVLLVGGAFLGWQRLHPVRSGHVDLVLAEIENTTNDPDFDRTLNQALLIDLEQSPFLNLLTRSRVRETLKEMQRATDEPLTPALAMEVCERTNAQAMLHGTIAKFGSHYLLILDADSCVSGKEIGGYKAEAASKEEVLRALEMAAGRVRKQLGESAASLDRYQIPITQATTPSLDALRAFSEAGESFRRGDMKAAQILLNRAVSLDPGFASAYRAIGSSYYNLGDYNQAANYYKKAFDLREHTTERERLGIEVMYYAYGLNDYEESIRRTRQLLEIYPNMTNSWVSLANLYTKLGEYAQSIDAAEHASRLDPQSSVATVELARAELKASHFADAKRIATEAIAEGKDHWDIHSILYQIAYLEHDVAKMKEEGAWGLSHQHANTSLYDMGGAAATGGKLREATDDLSRSRSEALRDGEADFAEGVLLREARVAMELNQPRLAAESLKQLKAYQGDPSDPGQLAYLKAMMGDVAFAERFVANSGLNESHNTVIEGIYVPLVNAQLALKNHKPEEAVRLLEPARVYQLRDYTVPSLRAQAETEAGRLEEAAADYRLILDNPGVDPISPLSSLAHLRLARVLVLEKKTDAARSQYREFLDAWRDADKSIALLGDARRELAQLH
jgi:DNA-binding winged helix-turn-helix (wHTH) protein/tetratricopeptide (TPR) repeat protein